MTQAQIIVRTPDGRDIPVQTDDPKLAAKAVRRMLAREAMSPRLNPKGVMKQGGFGAFTDAAANSATFGLSHLSNSGIAAGVTALKNLYTRAQGGQPAYGAGDAFAVEQAAQKAAAGEHPILSGLGGLLGGLGPGMEAGAGKFIMQGAAPLAARMGNVPGVSGLLKGLLTSGALPAIAARSVPLGAVGGALSQGASAPEAGQILPNAVSGAATGAAVSAAAPFAAKYVAAPVLKYAAAPVAKPVIKAAVGGARNLARTVNMLSAGAKSGPLLKPEWGALTAIRQALRADGATAAEIEAVSNQIASTGASTPALIDAVQKLPGGGQNTLKLLTGAAAKGKGANVAGRYVEDVSSKLQGRVQNRTQQLIGGDTRSLPGVQSDIASRIETATQGPNVTPGDAGAAVHAKLNEAYDAAQAATNRAYEAARSTRGTAALHPDSSAQLDQGVRTAIQDYEGLAPRAEALARQVRAAVKPADENIPPPPTGWERQFNNLDEYYAMMRRIPGMVPARTVAD
jgi:hypothetical protein